MQSVAHLDLLTPLLADNPEFSVLRDSAAWTTVKHHAGRFGVAPLIAYEVRSQVSGDDRAWCDRVLAESWTRHERMLRHLEDIVGILDAANVPALCLKGPLLARRYYNPPFLRKPSIDLDLAVMETDLPRAAEVLTRSGYAPIAPIHEAVRESHHLTLLHPSRPCVELHFRLSHHASGIRVDELFDRAVTCRLPGGLQTRVLGDADQLLHLILHLAHARFGTLFHLYEVRRAFRAASFQVRQEAVQRIIGHRYCGALRMADIAVRVRFGESLLPSEMDVPKTWLHPRLNEKVYRKFERGAAPGSSLNFAARLRGRWLDFQITDTPSDALRALWVFAQTARFQIRRGTWGRVKTLSYTPSHHAQ